MPYITQARREYMENDGVPTSAGELNFCLTLHLLRAPDDMLENALWMEVENYLDLKRNKGNQYQRGEISYALCNEIVGALECCRLEWHRRRGVSTRGDLRRSDSLRATAQRFYREVVAPYEDIKIQQNGDVFQ